MNYLKTLALSLSATCLLFACGNSNDDSIIAPVEPDQPNETISGFAKGADIGWVTEYESKGYNFYNIKGEKRECTALMKELGLDAIRIRVWVDPSAHGNWCNAADAVLKAKRAKELGMDVMIDFHYSDYWADPAQQYKPAAWVGKNLVDLKKAIAYHTVSVLQALKNGGITPKWVQVGNEITPGLLWDEDVTVSGASYDVLESDLKGVPANASSKVKYPKNWGNLAAFVNTGYDAVKSVFADAIVIVHLDNGHDNGLYTWYFDELKKNGGKWDMIGMSLYPYWTRLGKPDYTADAIIADCIKNINALSAKYNCDVMVVETGMECADSNGNLAATDVLIEGKRQLTRILKECKENTNSRCKGVFYWEPECKPGQYRLGAFTDNGRPTVIMDAFKEF
ncbi:MAG: glycosyl hydrolase 53 family protein [Bacteroides sp.]|uniref:glycoside hydrolase family 53 protein n=1 Tax=Bacteroides sp. TaxID=29523 RepID=UPI002FC58D45